MKNKKYKKIKVLGKVRLYGEESLHRFIEKDFFHETVSLLGHWGPDEVCLKERRSPAKLYRRF